MPTTRFRRPWSEWSSRGKLIAGAVTASAVLLAGAGAALLLAGGDGDDDDESLRPAASAGASRSATPRRSRGATATAAPTPLGEVGVVDAPGNFFVSTSGSDSDSGKRGAPFATIQKGIDSATGAGGGNVYVSAGTYPGVIILRSRVTVAGGFDPGRWVSDPARFPAIIEGGAIPGATVSVLAREATDATISGFRIVSPAGTATSPNSIGIGVLDSTGVRITGNEIVASDGVAGGRGDYIEPGQPGASGAGGLPAANCPPDRTGGTGGYVEGFSALRGGDGGKGGALGGFRGQDGSGSDASPGKGGAAGATAQAGHDGGDGADGFHGAQGSGGQALAGAALSSGTLARDGLPGGFGAGGGGGGGGGGYLVFACGGGGGGGGSGGEGGDGGDAGDAGGSSIGVYVFRSTVVIEGNSVETGSGGTGGDGSFGGTGGAGGSGGFQGLAGPSGAAGGHGGAGGSGGGGGVGGGGAGGSSIGILEFADASVQRSGNSFNIGMPGTGSGQVQTGAIPDEVRGEDGARYEYIKLTGGPPLF